MAKSIKKNYILNLINTVLGVIFPLITFPYASRILLADGIGLVNFYTNIISYISLLSSLGIPLYAIRESARIRDDNKMLSITASEILILHTFLTFIGYISVGIICLTVAKVQENILMFLLLSSSILLNTVGVNWFYSGIEDFKYITIRNIIIKVITICCLFIFVHQKTDLMWYAGISVIGSVGNNLFNLFRLRKYINIRLFNVQELHPLRHLKPALKIWVLNLVISVYTQLDIVMLGFMKSPTHVGYFTAAYQISTLLMFVTGSLSTVLLPRMSNLMSSGKENEFKKVSQKAMDFILLVSLPLTLGVFVLAGPTIRIYCGASYEPSIRTLQILSMIILTIGINGILMQILYSQGKEKIVTIATIFGAIINFTINLILIPIMAQDGAAIATVITEIVITVIELILGAKYLPLKYLNKQNMLVCLSSLLMFIVCLFTKNYMPNDIVTIIVVPLIGIMVYCIITLLNKNYVALEFVKILKNKIHR